MGGGDDDGGVLAGRRRDDVGLRAVDERRRNRVREDGAGCWNRCVGRHRAGVLRRVQRGVGARGGGRELRAVGVRRDGAGERDDVVEAGEDVRIALTLARGGGFLVVHGVRDDEGESSVVGATRDGG